MANFRHPDPACTKAYDVNVPFMQLGRHGWDIHAVSAERAGDPAVPLGPPPGGRAGTRAANLASGKLGADGKGVLRDGVVTGSRGGPPAARTGAAAGPRPAHHGRDLHGA